MLFRDAFFVLGAMGAAACPCVEPAYGQLQSQAVQADSDSPVPSRLTLEQAVRLAIARNPSIAAARNEIEALEGDSVAARKRLNPAATFEQADLPVRANPGPFFGTQEITLRLDYEIERGGRRQLRAKSAEQAVEAQKLAYQDQVRRIELEIKRAFSPVVSGTCSPCTTRPSACTTVPQCWTSGGTTCG